MQSENITTSINKDSPGNNQADPEIPTSGSLREIISEACHKYAHLTAFSCEGRKISYQELDSASDRFAAWLMRESTLVPGDRVAIQLPNLIQYPIAALGVLKAGMVIVNINPLYTAGESEHQLKDSGAKVLFTLEETLPVLSRIISATAIEKVIVTRAADYFPLPMKCLYNLSRTTSWRQTRGLRFSGKIAFSQVLSRGKRYLQVKALEDLKPAAFWPANEPVLGLIQYTGGTTGTAKGAMLSHDNLIANLRQVDHVIEDNSPPPGSVTAVVLPFYHIYAFTLNFLFSLYKGYHGVLIPDPRNTDKMVKALGRHKISCFAGVSTLFKVLCKHKHFQRLDFSGLSLCTSGGMALSVSTARRWEKLTGCRILEGYGLTECAPLVASSSYGVCLDDKIGQATRWTEIKIVNEDGEEVPAGTEGEIIVRGPQVMMGYWQKPEETRAVLKEDGWFHTGDIGILDEEGHLKVVDRIKDLIIVSGFNVYPAEIEDHVSRHPDIREAAAIGIPREEGELVKLFVISDNPELSEDEVILFCRQGLTAYKVPSKVEFRTDLPRSNVGKILRRQLREDQAV